MKNRSLILLLTLLYQMLGFAQKNPDTLVTFSDLKFHSRLEKKAIQNFIINHRDTFNLFMSIDSNIDELQSNAAYFSFHSIMGAIKKKKFEKNINRKKIKKAFSFIHQSLLQKYVENEYFPQIFINGTYNCVSASMLYALVFNELKIPYKIFQTPNHVYLLANPGTESVIIETTNPDINHQDFSNEYKRQYINNLKYAKVIRENESLNKSLEPKLSDSKNGSSLKAFESIAQSTKKLYAIHKSLHLKDELQQFLSRGIPK